MSLFDLQCNFGFKEIPSICLDFFYEHNFKYRVLEGQERDRSILEILKFVSEDTKLVATPDRQAVWHSGWNDNLKMFRMNKDLSFLEPKFISSGEVVRLNKELVFPEDPSFLKNYIKLIQLWFFGEYGRGYKDLHEFGCGTGFNLVVMAKLFPKSNIYGYDYVQSSVDLVKEMSIEYGFNIQSKLFDMISPNCSVDIKDSCIFTCASIEQLGDKYHNFIEFLLYKKPGICCHLEPITELLDEDNLIDYLAIKFQSKRNYSFGFLPYLQSLEAENKLEILKIKRICFGSLYTEGYNYIIWKPK